MPFRDPLPLDVLKYLSQQNKGNKDVQSLLWEIKRLQSLVLRQKQFTSSTQPWGPLLQTLWGELGDDIDKEPCVQRLLEIQQRSINP